MEAAEKDYNTRRPQMVIPEYGRNIQKMIDHAISTEDRDERNKIANAIISVMGQLNPHLRDIADFKHKLWDNLFIISDFKLDVDSPYPIPAKEEIMRKPEKMAYPSKNIRFKHYGKAVSELIEKAIAYPEGEEKEALIGVIANLMKKNYLTFSQPSVEDSLIIKDLTTLSQGKLTISQDLKIVATNEILAMTQQKRKSNNNNNGRNHKQNKKQHYKKRRY